MAKHIEFTGPGKTYNFGKYRFTKDGEPIIVADEEAADYLLSLPGFREAHLKKQQKRDAAKRKDGDIALDKVQAPVWPNDFKTKKDVLAFAETHLGLELEEKIAKKTLIETTFEAYVAKFGHPDGEGGVDGEGGAVGLDDFDSAED